MTNRVKITGIFLAVAIIFASCQQTKSASEIEKEFRVAPTEDGKSLVIIRYTGEKQSVNIPAKLHGMSVTAIGDSAFSGKELIAVTIPSSITTIGDRAFASNLLTKVTIPGNVTTIGDAAFANNRLIDANIGNKVTFIGEDAFRNNKLTKVTIGNSVATIGDGAFRNNNLNTVSIGNSVESIGPMSFKQNEITALTIHANNPEYVVKDFFILSKDEKQVISYIGSAESVIIPEGITVIKEWAMSRNNIKKVTLPNSLINIETCAFLDNKISEITIPGSVVKISENAFAENEITSITIGANVDLERNSVGYYFVTQYNAPGWGFGKEAGTYNLSRDEWSWIRQGE